MLGYEFKNLQLLVRALTHTSYVNENNIPYFESNQRLEFLGDAVLDMVISEELYNNYDNLSEGDMTQIRAKIVCEQTLAKKAQELNLGSFLFLGRGEEMSGGRQRQSNLADTFESLIGAIYLDGGLEAVRCFIKKHLRNEIVNVVNNEDFRNYKTLLQEMVQKAYQGSVIYEVVKEDGPDHDKTFYIQVKLGSKVLGRGCGKNKKTAEQLAAQEALTKLKVGKK